MSTKYQVIDSALHECCNTHSVIDSEKEAKKEPSFVCEGDEEECHLIAKALNLMEDTKNV